MWLTGTHVVRAIFFAPPLLPWQQQRNHGRQQRCGEFKLCVYMLRLTCQGFVNCISNNLSCLLWLTGTRHVRKLDETARRIVEKSGASYRGTRSEAVRLVICDLWWYLISSCHLEWYGIVQRYLALAEFIGFTLRENKRFIASFVLLHAFCSEE